MSYYGGLYFLYFKNELILLAFLRLRKQDFPGAKVWLDRIKNPEGSLVKNARILPLPQWFDVLTNQHE